MRAIILAAGEGTRLRPHTLDRPKCLVPLAGRPLLAWQADALRRAGVSDITVVTGYRADQVAALGFATVHNDRFRETNMVASLMCARALLDGWETEAARFSRVMPRDYRRVLALQLQAAETGVDADELIMESSRG